MNGETAQPVQAQGERKARHTRGRNRRVYELAPEIRRQISSWFHKGLTAERIGEDLRIPESKIIEHVVREFTGAKQPGPVLITRKPVASEVVTVRQMKAGAA